MTGQPRIETAARRDSPTSARGATVAALMSRDVKTCALHDRLDRVTRAMLEHELNCLPVVDERGRLLGVITARDVCTAAFALDLPLRQLVVEEAMSHDAVAVGPSESLVRAERLMLSGALRELPVIDAGRRVVGLLQIDAML